MRNSLRNSLGPPFGEELRVPDNSTISPDQRTPQSHGCSKGQAALSSILSLRQRWLDLVSISLPHKARSFPVAARFTALMQIVGLTSGVMIPVQIFSSPTVAGGRVYVGEGFHQDADCHLHCLDANSGRVIWTFKTASHVESTPFVSQGKVYFGAGNDGVYCLDALEGKVIWHYPAIHVDTSPAVWRGKVYFGTGYGEYRIYAVDANSGAEVWSKRVDYPVWGSPSADGDTVFFGLGNGNFIESAEVPKGRVTARNAETGEQIWEYEAEDSVLTAVAYRNGFVYFGSRDGGVYALNAADGALGWKSPIGHPVVSSPAVTESSVYVGADNGVIYKIDIDSGRIVWQFDTDKITGGEPIYSSPVIANGKLYIGLKDYLLCLGGEETMKGTPELDDQ